MVVYSASETPTSLRCSHSNHDSRTPNTTERLTFTRVSLGLVGSSPIGAAVVALAVADVDAHAGSFVFLTAFCSLFSQKHKQACQKSESS